MGINAYDYILRWAKWVLATCGMICMYSGMLRAISMFNINILLTLQGILRALLAFVLWNPRLCSVKVWCAYIKARVVHWTYCVGKYAEFLECFRWRHTCASLSRLPPSRSNSYVLFFPHFSIFDFLMVDNGDVFMFGRMQRTRQAKCCWGPLLQFVLFLYVLMLLETRRGRGRQSVCPGGLFYAVVFSTI